MNKRKMIERDAKTIESGMATYTGTAGAHCGFIAFATGERQFFLGGRSDLVGMGLAESIAKVVELTPQLDESFIDAVAKTAKEMLKNGKETKPQ